MPSRKYISWALSKSGCMFMTLENASSAWSSDPYLSYKMPMPYQRRGSCDGEFQHRHRWREEGGGRTNLGVREMDQRSLVCYVGLLEIVHHEVTMSCLLLGG